MNRLFQLLAVAFIVQACQMPTDHSPKSVDQAISDWYASVGGKDSDGYAFSGDTSGIQSAGETDRYYTGSGGQMMNGSYYWRYYNFEYLSGHANPSVQAQSDCKFYYVKEFIHFAWEKPDRGWIPGN